MTLTGDLAHRFWRDGGLEIALIDCSAHAFPKHFHDEYVIGVNVVGGEFIWLEGQNYDAGLNEVTLYNPGEVQSSRPLHPQWQFISIYFNQEYMRFLFGENETIIFEKGVFSSPPFAESLRKGCLQCLNTPQVNSLEVHEYILMICNGLLAKTTSDPRDMIADSWIVAKTIDQMLSELSYIPSLYELSQAVSLSPVQLLRTFKKSTRLTPLQWLRFKKLHMVKAELISTTRLCDLAFKYGFADQAHLTRHFKRLFGVTPGVYRKLVK